MRFSRLVLLLSLSIGAALVAFLSPEYARAGGKSSGGQDDFLESKAKIDFRIGTLHELADALRGAGVPISFAYSDKDRVVEVSSQEATLRVILDTVVAQNPDYQVAKTRAGRIALIPSDPKFRAHLQGVKIKDVPRLEAAQIYVEKLNHSVPGFEGLVPPLMKGSPDAPIYAQPVTLSESSTVLDHLFELLGDDPEVVFSIIPSKSGIPFLVFEHVKAKPAAPRDGVKHD